LGTTVNSQLITVNCERSTGRRQRGRAVDGIGHCKAGGQIMQSSKDIGVLTVDNHADGPFVLPRLRQGAPGARGPGARRPVGPGPGVLPDG
jgi:hypothetical protein